MNNKQKLLTATAITGTIVSASAFTVFDYAICRRKKQPDVRKKEKWKPYLDYVLKEQEWLKEHQEQELKEIRSKDGLTLRAVYIPRENAKGTIICMHGYHSTNDIEFVPESGSQEQRYFSMWNFYGVCYNLNGSRSGPSRQCKRNYC